MSFMNRLANSQNAYQGDAKRVLCVCSAGLLRSPTVAVVLSQEPFNFNTRAAGVVEEYALIPVDGVLITWAHEIVAMEAVHMEMLNSRFKELLENKTCITLHITDSYRYGQSELIDQIVEKYTAQEALGDGG